MRTWEFHPIVVARLNMTGAYNDPWSWPALAKLFTGIALGLDGRYTEVHWRHPVHAEDVLAIWQPGDPEYDRHAELPR